MRSINLIVIHCSDSDIPAHDNIETIIKWHTLPLIPKEVSQKIAEGSLSEKEKYKYGNGWKAVGYHYFIRKCGRVDHGRPEDEIGSHCKGYNKHSIGICLSGRSEFTEQQFLSAAKLVKDLMSKYNLRILDIVGHNQLSNKTCPNFDINLILEKLFSL